MTNETVYILHSTSLNRYYIGYSSDLDQRMIFHNNSEARKFTAKAKDWIIFYTIICSSKPQALKIEAHIKKMKSKIYLENLSKYPEISIKLLNKYSDC